MCDENLYKNNIIIKYSALSFISIMKVESKRYLTISMQPFNFIPLIKYMMTILN